MTTKHTPGPWKNMRIDAGITAQLPDGTASTIAHVDFSKSRDEWVANAVLIATAPELLDALKDAKQLLDALRMDSGVGEILTDSQRELYQAVDAKVTSAIAKAEGRTT